MRSAFRNGVAWALLALAPACAGANASTRTSRSADVALGPSLDRYITGFGKGWGEAAAFHGYVAVARDGRMIFGKAYGSSELGPDSLFRIASVSKTFTAVGILQLEQQGRLSIDDPIRKYLPELPPFADAVTIHHCLTHSSGLPPFPDDPALATENGGRHSLASALTSYKDKSLIFKPGERFEYSNASFTVLGAIIERVSGQSYEVYFQEHVFRPAGMVHTTTVSEPAPSNLAKGYAVDDRDAISPAAPVPPLVTFGCGAILSSANDLVAWDSALRGTRLLSEASKRKMFTPERDPGGIFLGRGRMALGWFVAGDSHWHGGGLPGFLTGFTSVPAAKLTVIVLSNRFSDYGLDEKISLAAEQIALTGTSPPPQEEPAPQQLTASQISALAGDYEVDAATLALLRAKVPPWVVERWSGLALTAKDGHLFMRWSEQEGPEVFRSTAGTIFTKQIGMQLVPESDRTGRTSAVALLKKTGFDTRYVRLSNVIEPAPPGRCPSGMARIAGGDSLAPFCMDLTEVTVAAYASCVTANRCQPAPTTALFEGLTPELAAKWNPTCNGARKDRFEHPINCVDWPQAAAFCNAQGKRLPAEAEWTWAARGGGDARKYPWGFREPDAQLCWSGREARTSTCPVASFPDGDAWGGIHDLAGNVGEWTATRTPDGYVMMGRGWNLGDATDARSVTRETAPATFRGPTTGFRCAL